MAVVIDITFDTEDGEQETHSYPIDPLKMPLTMIEGIEERKYGMVRRALARFLKLTDEQSEQLTIGHLNTIADAVKQAQTIPNE